MIRVVVDGLVKRFERVAIVDGASFEITPGELTYICGPSGAGKSTLARLIAGLESPDDGEIYFDGRVLRDVPIPERRVGLVPQQDALWPHLNVARNVGYGLKCQGVGRVERRRRVAEALGRSGSTVWRTAARTTSRRFNVTVCRSRARSSPTPSCSFWMSRSPRSNPGFAGRFGTRSAAFTSRDRSRC